MHYALLVGRIHTLGRQCRTRYNVCQSMPGARRYYRVVTCNKLRIAGFPVAKGLGPPACQWRTVERHLPSTAGDLWDPRGRAMRSGIVTCARPVPMQHAQCHDNDRLRSNEESESENENEMCRAAARPPPLLGRATSASACCRRWRRCRWRPCQAPKSC